MPITIPSNRTITLASKAGGGFQSAGLITTPIVAWRANEPAGLTQSVPLDFSQDINTVSGWNNYKGEGTDLIYGTDASQPTEGSAIARCRYPAGSGGGDSFVGIGHSAPGTGVKQWYMAISFKMSANFQYHLTGTNKLWFLNVPSVGGGGDPLFTNIDADTSPAQVRPTWQGPVGFGRVPAPVSTAEVLKGEWYIVEWYGAMNTAGNSDGIYKQWLTRVSTGETFLNYDLSDVKYAEVDDKAELPRFSPTWGGGGDTISETFYLDLSAMYLAWSET